MTKITQRTVDGLKKREADYFLWDDELAGFGVRVMRSGHKSYVVQYRAGGRTRRNAFSRVGTMTPDEARKHARELLVSVDKGNDPVAEIVANRRTPNVTALCDRYLDEHVDQRCKPTTQGDYRHAVEAFIKPRLGNFKIGDVKRPDIAQLHHEMRGSPYQANRTLSVLSKMFNLAEVWGLRADGSNPCRHVRKYAERKRERYLTLDEIKTLGKVLMNAERDGSEPKPVVATIRLLLLTGARIGEIQTLKWEHVRKGHLALPDSKTGAKRVPLGKDARDVLERITRVPGNPYVIVGAKPGQFCTEIQRPWRRIRDKAGLSGLRIHDLRHTFASVAAAEGESLTMIGKLLGHSQAQTTARYAHLAPDPVNSTADRISSIIATALTVTPLHPEAANDNAPLSSAAAE
jgi:integrase